jgi:hypothetical protein
MSPHWALNSVSDCLFAKMCRNCADSHELWRKRMQPETQISCVHEFGGKATFVLIMQEHFEQTFLTVLTHDATTRRHAVVTNPHYLSKLDFLNKGGHLRRLVNLFLLLSKEVLPRVGWEMPWRTSL